MRNALTYIDAYAISVGEKGHIEGFPENTYEVDLQGTYLMKRLQNFRFTLRNSVRFGTHTGKRLPLYLI